VSFAWIARRAWREVARRPGTSLALAGACAALALVAGGARAGARLEATLVPLAEQNVHVIAYLGDDADADESARLQAALRVLPGVARVEAVDSAEALRRLERAAASLGDGGRAVAGLEAGFLPRSLEVALSPGGDLRARAAELAARLRRIRGIVEVDAMTEGLGRLQAWLSLGRVIALSAVAVAALLALFAAAVAVARGRAGRRAHAATLHFLGATTIAIRAPGALASAAAALAGTALGLGALAIASPRALGWLERSAGLVRVQTPPALVGRELALALGAAVLLGALVGALATPRPSLEGEHA
jgi:cell division protein FtsX